MIDWYHLAANSLWIFSLALALATLSYARWEARELSKRVRTILSQHKWQIPLNIAGVLFCGGLAATTNVTWERAIWGILAILFIIQLVFISNELTLNL